ncbi:MAG: UDP-N-acetylglucosamine 1-carboxyvinyltransferase, partial [Actinomycetota bacterium]|nr:UDP-N-acetylglucosamine 1-carboxyvinyltransferase [Actinomycetota bacterium]
DVAVHNARPEHLEIALDKLATSGATVTGLDDGFRVVMDRRPSAVDAVTLPYPGLATDLQPLMMALDSVADGAAMITENIFEGRFVFANELARLGAHVRTDGHHAVVRGVPRLSGAPVRASDIRAGAALTIAGLVAEGITYVSDVFHVDRGYPGFDQQLRELGADVTRVPEPPADFLG